jgi:hypothetical protein
MRARDMQHDGHEHSGYDRNRYQHNRYRMGKRWLTFRVLMV